MTSQFRRRPITRHEPIKVRIALGNGLDDRLAFSVFQPGPMIAFVPAAIPDKPAAKLSWVRHSTGLMALPRLVLSCRCGGDVSGAEVVLVAVPGGLVANALGAVTGIESKTVIDTPTWSGVTPPVGLASSSEYLRSRTAGQAGRRPRAGRSCRT